MSTSKRLRSAGILSPIDRISEALFGLIMVLTFTGSLSAAEAGRAEVQAMLVGALGCNLAWGIIDGILYLMGCLAEEGRGLAVLRAIRSGAGSGEAHTLFAGALPSRIGSIITPADVESIRARARELPDLPARPALSREAWLGALGVFIWVVVVTFPVAVPFIFMTDAWAALRVSNAVAVILLFVTGYAFGRYSGNRPWVMGLSMILVGIALVGLTIALGG